MIDSDRPPLLKSASTDQCYYLKSWSNLRVFSNQHPFQILRSMANLLVRAYVSDVIDLRKWETAIDLRIGCWFENLKKGHRSEVRAKTGWLIFNIKNQCVLVDGGTYLPTNCCISDLALYKSNWVCWSSTKRTPSSSHINTTCLCHDITDR